MKLEDQLNQCKIAGRSGLTPKNRRIFETHPELLRRSGILNSIAGVGDLAKGFTLPNHEGQTWNLDLALRAGPVILKFYRGNWCPYCNLELRAYQTRLSRIRGLGASFVAISPEKPDAAQDFFDNEQINYPVLSDSGNTVAKQFGLVFTVEPELKTLMQSHGIELADRNIDGRWTLPIPGVFIISKVGEILYSYAEPDFSRRADPDEVVLALEHITK